VILPGYEIRKKLYEGERTLVFCGRKVEENHDVVIKVSAREFPKPDEINRYRREFELGNTVVSNRVIRYRDLVPYKRGFAIVQEDFGGIGLANLIPPRGMEAKQFLNIAVQLAEGLSAIHGKDLIHKDIKPSNIVICPETSEVKYIDFGQSKPMAAPGKRESGNHEMHGTLAYMSPEQTGRMNLPIDYRTDFYSLGVTFFQLLTGELPFQSEDTLEVIHAHIAKMPRPVHRLKEAIPAVISEIVLKLMAKAPEDRYQSGRGLKYDLELCQEELERRGRCKTFKLASRDITNRFSISPKLYGREHELESLVHSFQRTAQGNKEMVVVEGYSGVGKSALVNEIRLQVLANKGYFLRSSCDQGQTKTGHAVIKDAFGDWVRQILGEHEDSILEWRQRLSDVLGPNLSVVTDFLPELALLFAEQAESLKSVSQESRGRFNLVFRNLVKGIACREHPLVLFLDDLQWADALSIKVLDLILADNDIRYLMVITTTNQNALEDHLRLRQLIEEMERRGTPLTRLRLGPLDSGHLTRMLVDTLHCETDEARPLAGILHSKTNGNPFFTHALLKNLYQEKHLRFCHDQCRWDWDLCKIRKIRISENVTDFLIGRLKQLKPDTQQVLHLASCLAGTIEPRFLAELEQTPAEDLIQALNDAVRLGVLMENVGTTPTYQFQHDRVQQAAYALIDEHQKMAFHLMIGRGLLARQEQEKRLFEVVGHLNQGRELIDDPEETLVLAHLNLEAGKKAKAATAFEDAAKYLRICFALMTQDAWDRHYLLVYSLFWESSECHYLCGEFKVAEKFSSRLLKMARNDLQKAEIYKLRLTQYTLASKMDKALEAGTHGLALLGLKVPEKPGSLHLLREKIAIRWHMRRLPIEELVSYKQLNHPTIAMIIEILAELAQPAYLTGQKHLFLFCILKRMTLTLRHGISAMAANTFAMYGFLLSSVANDIRTGARFGEVALKISGRYGNPAYHAMALYAYSMGVHIWNHPWGTLTERLEETMEVGLQSGDLLFASYACSAMHYFDPEEDLETSLERSATNLALIENLEHLDTWRFAKLVQQFRLNLLGRTAGLFSFDDEAFDERACIEHFRTNNVASGVALFYLLKIRVAYLYQAYDKAQTYLVELRKVVKSLTGQPFIVEVCLYTFLVTAANWDNLDEKRAALALMTREQARMKRWAMHNANNFSHYHALMAAERARLKGAFQQATNHYREALEKAHQHGSFADEALTCELAASFFRQHGHEKIASVFYTDAHYLYGRWGATGKIRLMEKNQFFSGLIKRASSVLSDVEPSRNASMSLGSTSESMTNKAAALDLATVTKWSLALSGIMDMDQLLPKMMAIILENAGAQKGFLILEKEGGMTIEATTSVESHEVDLRSQPLDSETGLSKAIIRYVIRTAEHVVLHDAAREGLFTEDSYVLGQRPKSILCTPIKHKERVSGVLYLENNLITNAFTEDRMRILQILLAQAAISLENARLYRDTKQAESNYRELSEELEERVRRRTRELEVTQKELVEKAHMAGMADIATTVLHNVGNILNSVITSSQILKKRLEESSIRRLVMANGVLRDNLDQIGDFITNDPKGLQLLQYYLRMESPIVLESKDMNDNVDRLIEKVNTIREVIMAQQSHASRGFQEEYLNMADVVDEALLIVENSFSRHEIILERCYEEVPPVWVQKVKLIHILVNLLKNAKEAMVHSKTRPHKITLSINGEDEYTYVRVRDNGIGIGQETLGKLFIQGYTTKADGHGFGLHSCANSMTEMSGNIWVESEGLGKGTTFVLQFRKKSEPAASNGSGPKEENEVCFRAMS